MSQNRNHRPNRNQSRPNYETEFDAEVDVGSAKKLYKETGISTSHDADSGKTVLDNDRNYD